MRKEPTLFEEPLSRNSDPVTSFEAAEELHRSGKHATQSKAVLKVLELLKEATSAEIACHLGWDRHIPARRLPELRKRGLVEQRRARRCTVLGRNCVTWALGGDM